MSMINGNNHNQIIHINYIYTGQGEACSQLDNLKTKI